MIGIDAVDVERLRNVMVRDPRTAHRLFTDSERAYCGTKTDPAIHFAGTLAVKEAVIKAARLGPLLAWGRRIQVHRDASGVPTVGILGRPDHRFDISISHDGPVAVAVAVASNGRDRGGKTSHTEHPRHPRSRRPSNDPLIPNQQLLGYLGMVRSDAITCDSLMDAADLVGGSDFP